MSLTGIMNTETTQTVNSTEMNRRMVLRNVVLFGTVNAGRRHWEQAVDALAAADPAWLSRMITRRVPVASWTDDSSAGPTTSRSWSTLRPGSSRRRSLTQP